MTNKEKIEKIAGKTIVSVEATQKTEWMDELGEISLIFSDGSEITLKSTMIGYEFGAIEIKTTG